MIELVEPIPKNLITQAIKITGLTSSVYHTLLKTKKGSKLGRCVVKYSDKSSRLHATMGLKCMPRWIRTVVGEKLWEVDIINSQPTLLYQYVRNHVACPTLATYVSNREKFLEEYKCTKKDIIHLLNGKSESKLPESLNNLHTEYVIINGVFGDVSKLYCKLERKVLDVMRKEPGVCTLIYDAVLSEMKIDTEALTTKIKETCGFDVKLRQTQLKPTDKERHRFWDVETEEERDDYELLLEKIQKHASENKLVRYKSEVWKPAKIPGVFDTIGPYTDFANKLLKTEFNFHKKMMFKHIIFWLEHCDHLSFPFIQTETTNKIGFKNGVLNITDMKLEVAEHGDFIRVFFDVDCPTSIETPNWDSVLQAQLDDSSREVLEALLGRLFFPVGVSNGSLDSWQVCPLLIGNSNTGKSTITNLLKDILRDVGTLNPNYEKVFGLSMFYATRAVLIDDVDENLFDWFNQAMFQSMVSGGVLNIPRKNEAAQTISWKTPILISGNAIPKISDNSGSVSRRFAVFRFGNLIEATDNDLPQKLSLEAPKICIRILRAYKTMREHTDGKDFWGYCQKHVSTMIEAKEDVSISGNLLSEFLADGNSKVQVLHDNQCDSKGNPVYMVPMKTFEQKLMNHLKFNVGIKNPMPRTYTKDLHPLLSRGFNVKSINLCKECGQRALKETCGDHYNPRNRKKQKTILNMRFTTLSDSAP